MYVVFSLIIVTEKVSMAGGRKKMRRVKKREECGDPAVKRMMIEMMGRNDQK